LLLQRYLPELPVIARLRKLELALVDVRARLVESGPYAPGRINALVATIDLALEPTPEPSTVGIAPLLREATADLDVVVDTVLRAADVRVLGLIRGGAVGEDAADAVRDLLRAANRLVELVEHVSGKVP
jgi:hypothetical protein